MFLTLLDCYRANRWRVLLVDVALCSVVFTCIAVVRFLTVFAFDVQHLQMAQASESAAMLSEIRTQGSDLNKNIHKIGVQSEVVVGRLDSQITELRVLVNRSQRDYQKTAAQEVKETRKVLTDSISNTAAAIAAGADKPDSDQKPIQVVVPPIKAELIEPKAVPSAPMIVQGPPSPAPQKEQKPGFWHRIFHLGG